MANNLYIFCWDNYGLEACINATELDKNHVFNVLSDKKQPNELNHIINVLLLRAKANEHRHYEIYSCYVEDNINQLDLVKMFNDMPQQSADTIRKMGKQLYSNRANLKKAVIL